MDSNVLLNINT